MGASQPPKGSPFTADERIQIKACVERLIQERVRKTRAIATDSFQETRLALYENFIKTYLAHTANFPPNFNYHAIIETLGEWKTGAQVPEIELFLKLRNEWDITMLGYLFEFLRGFQVSVAEGKVELVTERAGHFRSQTGSVFTPYDICEKMMGNAFQYFENAHHDQKLIPNVLDPACGGGAFLIAVVRALSIKYSKVEMQDLVLTHLHGIDVDPEAVFISRLSLWGLIGDPKLDPKRLTQKILAGNTLLAKEAPKVLKAGDFDIVIGNPPYVRQEKIRDLKSFLAGYKSFSPTADLYVYFFEKGVDLLKPGGILSFIASNSFLRTHSARPLRMFLKENVRILDFYDSFQGPVFAAGVTPCILTLQKSPPSGHIRINDGEEMPQSSLEDRAWSFLPEKYLQLLRKMDQCPSRLVDFCDVYFCIKPGRVQDLVLAPVQISDLGLEEALFQPVLRGTDVKQYRQPVPKVKIFFPYDGTTFERLDWQVIAKKYPQIHQYLLERRGSLEGRDDYQRNKDHMMWYELRPCNYYPEFRHPKILTPDICHSNSFTLDAQGHLCLDTIFMIRPRDKVIPIEFWVGFLNSPSQEFFMKMTCSSLGTKGFRYKKQFLEKIPVPNLSPALVDQIARLTRENLNQQMPALQEEIDHLLFQTFGFSEKDAQILREFLQRRG